MATLVRSDQNDHRSVDTLRSRVVELEGLRTERAAEVARIEQDLAAFTIEYRRRVGLLHEQLDELELKIAEAELGVIAEQVKHHTRPPNTAPAADRPEPLPRFTSDTVRKLFRDVAKAIHPDLAQDASARDRHHRLMIEANRAYAVGDEARLRWILQSWQQRPEAVQGSDEEAMRLRLVRRIAQIEEQLVMYASEIERLKDSPMWKLKTMIDEAAAKGKDLVREMVVRLRRDIMVARNRLEAMQSSH